MDIGALLNLYLRNLFFLLADIAPYFLVGLLVAGLIKVFLPHEKLSKHLGQESLGAVFKAALLGIPLPLCSCGVLPVAVSLRRSGAGLPATMAFLVTTPQTSIDAIFITFGLFGGAFALAYPLAALIAGVSAGLLVYFFFLPHSESPLFGGGSCAAGNGPPSANPLVRAIRYSFLELPAELTKPFVVGLLLAAALTTLLPPGFLGARVAEGPMQYLIMLLAGIPIYTCSTGSLPLAYSFYLQGFSPGSLLVFLMSGPATNVTSLVVVKKLFGLRAFLVYAASLIGTALLAGIGLDLLNQKFTLPLRPPLISEDRLSITEEISALILGVLLFYHLLRPYLTFSGG